MIIQSGWDLMWIARAALFDREVDDAPVVIIVCNPDLRVIAIETLPSTLTVDDVLDHVDGLYPDDGELILGDFFDVAYVAIARLQHHRSAHDLPPDGWYEWHEAVQARGWRSLGLLELGHETWHSSGPMHELRDYGGEYPLAWVVRGPHPFDCSCVVCVAETKRRESLGAHVQENVQ